MKYISTRGGTAPLTFRETVMEGLARDGGLLLPERIPDVSDRLAAWRKLDYVPLACEVMSRFTDLPVPTLHGLVAGSYADFRHAEVTPLVRVGDRYILELFHGPTLAFKDVALQFLGRLFETVLAGTHGEMNILGATSGDTGSAAIHGVRGRRGIRIFILHPKGRVSPVQERQMTSVLDANVFNVAVEGTFDDCQRLVKTVFGDLAFRDRCRLGAVNSINWARVLAQVVYYFYAAFRAMDATGAARVRIAVPTGNFGDIFAGYVAVRMGLPVSRLVLATNENDILTRFFNEGVYSLGAVRATLSPSMDIQVASNFERYLYYAVGEDPARLKALMAAFAATGALRLDPGNESPMVAGSCDRRGTLATIRDLHDRHGYLVDPHTAVGVAVAGRFLDPAEPMICLATAHPAKFPDAIREALGRDLARHPLIEALNGLPTRCDTMPASAETLKTYVAARTAGAPHG
jgi:threonine synthase